MLERFLVGTFIACFFAALPFWFLTGQEGSLRFRCGGTPWQCTVERQWLWQTKTDTYTPSAIHTSEGRVSYKTRSSPAWQLVFVQGGTPTNVLAWQRANRDVLQLADQLDAARGAGQAVDLVLPADFVYFFAIALVLIFAASGYVIAFAGRGTPLRGSSARRGKRKR